MTSPAPSTSGWTTETRPSARATCRNLAKWEIDKGSPQMILNPVWVDKLLTDFDSALAEITRLQSELASVKREEAKPASKT